MKTPILTEVFKIRENYKQGDTVSFIQEPDTRGEITGKTKDRRGLKYWQIKMIKRGDTDWSNHPDPIHSYVPEDQLQVVDEGLNEVWYNPTTWFEKEFEPKLGSFANPHDDKGAEKLGITLAMQAQKQGFKTQDVVKMIDGMSDIDFSKKKKAKDAATIVFSGGRLDRGGTAY